MISDIYSDTPEIPLDDSMMDLMSMVSKAGDAAMEELQQEIFESASNQASKAITKASKIGKESMTRLSLDDYVAIIRKQPGAVEVVDLRPIVVIVKFGDGSGVGINKTGLDLLAAKS